MKRQSGIIDYILITYVCVYVYLNLQEHRYDQIMKKIDGIEEQLKMILTSGVAKALTSANISGLPSGTYIYIYLQNHNIPGICWHLAGLMKLLSSATLVCVCTRLHSCDIEPVQPVEQVCYVQKYKKAILCMGVAIVTKHVVTETNLIRPLKLSVSLKGWF